MIDSNNSTIGISRVFVWVRNNLIRWYRSKIRLHVLCIQILTLSQNHILDCSKLKDFADDNFRFERNGKKFYKRGKNTVGKGDIALYKQFLLFPQCFQRTCTARERVNPLPDDKILDWSKLKQIADILSVLIKMKHKFHNRSKNIVRKGEIACYKQFLLFSQCFPPLYISLVCQNVALCGNWLMYSAHKRSLS